MSGSRQIDDDAALALRMQEEEFDRNFHPTNPARALPRARTRTQPGAHARSDPRSPFFSAASPYQADPGTDNDPSQLSGVHDVMERTMAEAISPQRNRQRAQGRSGERSAQPRSSTPLTPLAAIQAIMARNQMEPPHNTPREDAASRSNHRNRAQYPFVPPNTHTSTGSLLDSLIRDLDRGSVPEFAPRPQSSVLAGLHALGHQHAPPEDTERNPIRNYARSRFVQGEEDRGLPNMTSDREESTRGVHSASFTVDPSGTIHVETQVSGGNAPPTIHTNGNFPVGSLFSLVNGMMQSDTMTPTEISSHFQHFLQTAMPNGATEGNETYEDWTSLIESMGGNVCRSATKQEIDNLPTNTVTAESKLRNKPSGEGGAGPSTDGDPSKSLSSKIPEEEKDKCAICMAHYEVGEEVKTLTCTHIFHTECIDQWLKLNRTCPVCKQSIRALDGPAQ